MGDKLIMKIKFKDYIISKPLYIGKDSEPWEFTVCKKHGESEAVFVIADFWYNFNEPQWEFRSCGTRYLEYYTEGLNEWILKVMELLECQLKSEVENDC